MKSFLQKMRWHPAIVVLTVLVASCTQTATRNEDGPGPTVAATQTYSYARDIKPILEQKCIACHACYDAPCQLKLSSAEGVQRGATRKQVYDSARLTDVSPTRLFVDAQTPAGWRDKGFYSVFNDRAGPIDNNLEYSLLYKMIELGREHPLDPYSAVPEHIQLGLQRTNECPLPGEFEEYAKKKPLQGMPLAITGLEEGEYRALQQWIKEGAVIDERPSPPGYQEKAQILQWEAFLNQPAPRNQLVSRYLYEHLFLAHLYFEHLDSGNFFELVRSRTPVGEPIQIIPTVRPNDDPGQPFFYRLRKIEGTIVHKTHIVYPLGEQKLDRLHRLFLTPQWEVGKLPDYSAGNALNPFATFAAIPARARYQFMLDTAEYFVMTFIRGPVCRGQVATDVIDDRFYVLFQDPDSDLSVTDPAYMASVEPLLALTPEKLRLLALAPDWAEQKHARDDYIRFRGKAYRERQPAGPSLQDIWAGDDTNGNAVLTVFRNFDNAMVTRGFVGAVPKTLWVMDYPMLERTYYELVVNFNVFGSAGSQAETRLYFDLIRSGGENNFLHFMPPAVRAGMRNSWYRGSRGEEKLRDDYIVVNEDMPVQIRYRTADPKAEFVSLVSERLGSLAGPPDVLNRCARPPCYRAGATGAERQVEASLQSLTSKSASHPGMRFVDFMPDVSFVRFSSGDPDTDLAYTLVRNKAHTNVAFLLDEEKRREPDRDTLTAYRGLLGSYPNFMFNVPLDSAGSFTSDLHAAGTPGQFANLVKRYGLSRTHPEIWANFQWFVDYMRRVSPVEAGVYDMNRYKKVADLMADESG